jgi:hypothetical protein
VKFRRIDDYAEESECARYTVCAAKVNGIWTFQGWRRANMEGDIATLVTRGRVTIAEDARKACTKDARRIAAELKKKAA